MICVSVTAKTASELIEQLNAAKEFADVIEVRFDSLASVDFETLVPAFDEFRRGFPGKVLATFRPANGGQGGFRELTREERSEFWRDAHMLADWCDIEADIDQVPQGFDKVIRSHHFFDRMPDGTEMNAVFDKLSASGCDAVKIAAQADDFVDSLPVWKLLSRTTTVKNVIAIAMGEAGKWTRIVGPAHGSLLTYAAPDRESTTAPGQITANDLATVYRVSGRNRDTKIYGIIGGNTSYSMSPYIHNAAFTNGGFDSMFVPFQVADLDRFVNEFVRGTAGIDLRGLSVTIPHKVDVIKYLDDLDDSARKIGAVNTIRIDAGRMTGFNTDADGFIKPLREHYPDLRGVSAAIFGAGGAARACAYALVTAGAELTVFARNAEKSRALAREFGCRAAMVASDDTFEIVVNATPLGTTGPHENESSVPDKVMRSAKLAYDLVYNPFETRFLKDAKAHGLKTLGGFEMLLAQAVRQQEIWTGVTPDEGTMREAALAKLSR